jgi:hypothetical protein
MRKLLAAAAVIAVGTLGMASRASAQAYYPGTNGAPASQGGYYPYPGTYGGYPGNYGTYPSYPQQSSTVRDHRRDDDRYDRRARRDDDDRRDRNDNRYQYDRRDNYGYGVGANVPSRVGNHDAGVNGRNQSRDGRWDGDR